MKLAAPAPAWIEPAGKLLARRQAVSHHPAPRAPYQLMSGLVNAYPTYHLPPPTYQLMRGLVNAYPWRAAVALSGSWLCSIESQPS
jgi:hypothetical protein